MRKFIVLNLFALLLPSICISQNQLTIKGKVNWELNGKKIKLIRLQPLRFSKNDTLKVIDIINGSFIINVKTNGANLYQLTINDKSVMLCLQPGIAEVNIHDSLLRDVNVVNNPAYREYQLYKTALLNDTSFTKYLDARQDLRNYQRSKGLDSSILTNKEDNLERLLLLSNKTSLSKCLTWIKANPNSYINPIILYDQLKFISDSELETVFNKLPEQIKDNTWAKLIKFYANHLSVGKIAAGFSQTDVNGKLIKLSDFKGRYVLIDFWASWCLPCRKMNPALVKIVDDYRSKKFTVLGISLDDNKENWINSIKTDKLKWTNLSDLNGWSNAVSLKYLVKEIPGNFLLDPQGKILAKNIYGNDLEKILKSIND